MPRIRSIIEIQSSKDDTPMKPLQGAPEAIEREEKSDGSLSSNKEEKGSQYRSEAVSDRHRMFHSVRQRHGNVNQQVNVEVKIEQQSDQCLTGCFKAIGNCFGRR